MPTAKKTTGNKPPSESALGIANQGLYLALSRGDESALSAALAGGADPNCPHPEAISPLTTAALAGHARLAKLLLAAGADVNARDPESGNTALAFATYQPAAELASISGRVEATREVARELLAAGADADAENFKGRSPRFYAQANGRRDILDLMPKPPAGADRSGGSAKQPDPVEPLDPEALERLGAALASGRSAEMARALGSISMAAFSDAISEPGFSALAGRLSEGLASGGLSPGDLALAVERHAPEAAAPLAFSSTEPSAGAEDRADYGSAFDRACALGRVEAIRFWSKACGPDWNPDGMSPPLSWTIYGGRPEAARELLALGADPNSTARGEAVDSSKFDVSGDAPLHLAIGEGQREIALALLGAGAAATGTDRDTLAGLRQEVTEAERSALVASLSKLFDEGSLDSAARGAAGLGALHACGWTRDADYVPLVPRAAAALLRFGDDLRSACARELEAVAHLAVEFEARMERKGAAQSYYGSILDRAAAKGELAALEFFALAAGPNWNPEGEDRPIDWAANVGDARAIEILGRLGAHLGASPEDADGKSMPPLARAGEGSWREAAAKLLDLGADPSELTPKERARARATLGEAGLKEAAARASASMALGDPVSCYFGLRQLWSMAQADWAPDWSAALGALDHIGVPAFLEEASPGVTMAGASLAREGGRLLHEIDGAKLSPIARAAALGREGETAFLARSLGPNFRAPGDSGSALLEAARAGQAPTARILLNMGASPNVDKGQTPLSAAAERGDAELFLELALRGADAARLSDAARAKLAPIFEDRAWQSRLVDAVSRLPAKQEGFDFLLAPGSVPASMAAEWIKQGSKERFWKGRDLVDWTRNDARALVSAAEAESEPGMGAYAKFRRALAADDVEGAAKLVAGSSALLASLTRRGLAEEAIMAALGAGRAELTRAMAQSGWPMESTMRERAPEVLAQAAAARDPSMFEQLLPLLPADGALSAKDQEAIARSAFKLGGSALVSKLDERLEGIDPAALDACRDLFAGAGGERAFCEMVLAGVKREATRSRALDKREQRAGRRKQRFNLAVSHWSGFSEPQKLDAARAMSSWNEPGFWESAEKVAARGLRGEGDGPEAFFGFCFGSGEAARAVFESTAPEQARALALAGQMAAAGSDDAEMARAFTLEAGVPSSEGAILRAARMGHREALTGLLARAEGSTLKGLLSRALIHPSADEFVKPECPGYEAPDWACAALCAAGASFEPSDLEGAGAAKLSALAALASQGKVSLQRERSFSALVLKGALPEASWMDKRSIMSREPDLMEMANWEDRNDEALALAAASADGLSLRHCGPVAQASIAVARAACAQNIEAAFSVHKELARLLGVKPDGSNALEVLNAAGEALESINPLKLLRKRAAEISQRQAQDHARSEAAMQARAGDIDFAPFERSLMQARLSGAPRAMAEMTLSAARAFKQAAERRARESMGLDLAELRRIMERNLPDLLDKYAATAPDARDSYNDERRQTPNQMLKKGFEGALSTINRLGESLDDAARSTLSAEATLLASKGAASRVLSARRQAEIAQSEGAPADAESQAEAPDGAANGQGAPGVEGAARRMKF